ncbi:MAG: hypothetical protein NZX77_23125, partial [Polyangiaceae bacterium]|nr:hypothetical protein [Polyangiaceae bacterium]
MATEAGDSQTNQTAADTKSDAKARLRDAMTALAATNEGAAPSDAGDEGAASHLGVLRYVLAGFFAATIAAAFVLGKLLTTI